MNIAYVYPWDVVGDPAAAERIAGLGVEAVALAVAYHSTRAATPYHPNHRVLDVAHSALYLPVRPEAWGTLVPASPTWTAPDSWLQAAEALRAVGLKVLAWTVLTHNSHLGAAHPDLVTRNAFGDRYSHSLCPAHPEVVDYCERLVREILTVGSPDGLILESCGPMGFGHQNMHEKTAGADWNGPLGDLLSLCFCTACASRYPIGTRELVKAAIDGGGPFASITEALSETDAVRETETVGKAETKAEAVRETKARSEIEALSEVVGETKARSETEALSKVVGETEVVGGRTEAVRAVRVDLSATLRARLIAVARECAPGTPITLHANPDPWAAGAFAALPYGEPGVDVLVGNCWGDPAADSERLAKLGAMATEGQRIGAYVLALPPRPADADILANQLAAYAKAGATEFHLYHAGLASPARLAALREALTR